MGTEIQISARLTPPPVSKPYKEPESNLLWGHIGQCERTNPAAAPQAVKFNPPPHWQAEKHPVNKKHNEKPDDQPQCVYKLLLLLLLLYFVWGGKIVS